MAFYARNVLFMWNVDSTTAGGQVCIHTAPFDGGGRTEGTAVSEGCQGQIGSSSQFYGTPARDNGLSRRTHRAELFKVSVLPGTSGARRSRARTGPVRAEFIKLNKFSSQQLNHLATVASLFCLTVWPRSG
ncbi:hypothetical protein EVAR_16555_1 [Eumeta japonica]|uniref:Uncharacterized protein n=1 Tax=Eumeta variegata TaxID=151549 RepID=A0A4C1U2Y8_EUMVA|nr:hypothetical protein EVAR_16555_1 [Eumeta japonica]